MKWHGAHLSVQHVIIIVLNIPDNMHISLHVFSCAPKPAQETHVRLSSSADDAFVSIRESDLSSDDVSGIHVSKMRLLSTCAEHRA